MTSNSNSPETLCAQAMGWIDETTKAIVQPVHLSTTNIRDVVHKRLLKKKPEAQTTLRALFQKHRGDLKLYGYACEEITEEDFVEVYPMLPGHIDLLMQITSNLRSRSTRARDVSTRAQAGGAGSSRRKESWWHRPSKISPMCSQPTRACSSSPGNLPKVATVRWRGPDAVRTDSSSVQYA